MPCIPFQINGARGIMCVRGQKKHKCSMPNCTRTGTILCDFPDDSHKSGTCDIPICSGHATHVGDDRDYCNVKHKPRPAIAPDGATGAREDEPREPIV